MRKPVYRVIVYFLSLTVSGELAAQQDHVVLTNGDTLWGVVKNLGSQKMLFETTTSSMVIDNSEIRLYYDSGKKLTFCRRAIPGPSQPVFITRLIEGPIRFFTYKVVSGFGSSRVTTTTWFAEKDSIPLGEIKAGGLRGGKQERKEFFRSLIAYNPAVVKRFDEEENYKIEFLEELIKEYNKQAEH